GEWSAPQRPDSWYRSPVRDREEARRAAGSRLLARDHHGSSRNVRPRCFQRRSHAARDSRPARPGTARTMAKIFASRAPMAVTAHLGCRVALALPAARVRVASMATHFVTADAVGRGPGLVAAGAR